MSKYTTFGNRERQLTTQHLHLFYPNYTDLTFTDAAGTDKYDCSFIYNNQLHIAEVKVRDLSSTDSRIQEGLICEQEKYYNVLDLAEAKNAEPVYIMFFDYDQMMIAYNMKEYYELEPVRKLMNAQTAESRDAKKYKWVKLLPLTNLKSYAPVQPVQPTQDGVSLQAIKKALQTDAPYLTVVKKADHLEITWKRDHLCNVYLSEGDHLTYHRHIDRKPNRYNFNTSTNIEHLIKYCDLVMPTC
jgi:hypothetical protein